MPLDSPPPIPVTDTEASRSAKPARGRGRPVGDHGAKRAELMKAAVSMIAHEGFAGASLRKVAQRAGCTTGAVTYYFANKEAMVVAIAEHLFDEFDTLRNRSQDDLKRGLELWFDWTSAADADPWLAGLQLVVHAKNDPAVAAVYQRRYGDYREILTRAVQRSQARGVVRTDIPADILADQISAIADGWMIMFPIEPQRFTPERVRILLDYTMALIAPPGGAK